MSDRHDWDFLRPLRDADWRRTHILAHLLGGAVWYFVLHLPPLDLTSVQLLLWTTVIQGVWERYQREYDPTYPLWSMVWDTGLAILGCALLLVVEAFGYAVFA